MLRFGADRIFNNAEGLPPSDSELDAILDRSVKIAQGERTRPFFLVLSLLYVLSDEVFG